MGGLRFCISKFPSHAAAVGLQIYIEKPECNAISIGNQKRSGHDMEFPLCLFVLIAENTFIQVSSRK